MSNLTIKARLVIAVGFLSLLLLSIGLGGVYSLNQANDALKTTYEDDLTSVEQLSPVIENILRNQVRVATALSSSPAEIAAHLEKAAASTAEANRQWAAYASSSLSAEEKALADKFVASWKSYNDEGLNPTIAALKANDTAAAQALFKGPVMRLIVPVRETTKALMDLQSKSAKEGYIASQSRFERFRMVSIGAIVAGLLIAASMGFWLVRSITAPLEQAVKIAAGVAAGDLTQRIEVSSADETGQLTQALRDMNESLLNIVGRVRDGTDAITTAAAEIAAGNLDLSSRTEQQASALEETASSMEELTSTVRQNSENAKKANELAVSASEIASKGGSVVGKVVDTMGSINESSRKIVEIISVIDGIAFQTNILALNAAVEAARAGEQGRGFAVVASEVRNLAQRSASAAKEIKSLIDTSVEKISAGSELVTEAGRTMAEIVTSVKRVTEIMGDIAIAGAEQEAGIEQINTAITEMDNATQQNAALVEEAAAAAGSLQEQAGELLSTVSIFKLSEPATAAPPKRGSILATRGVKSDPGMLEIEHGPTA